MKGVVVEHLIPDAMPKSDKYYLKVLLTLLVLAQLVATASFETACVFAQIGHCPSPKSNSEIQTHAISRKSSQAASHVQSK